MKQPKEILYTISVLQNEIDNIDNILRNGHLLEDGTEMLEREREYLQEGINKLNS